MSSDKTKNYRENAVTKEKFIKRIKELYGNQFDCSDIKYRSLENPVYLYCNKHQNHIKMTARSLYNGGGCCLCDQHRIKSIEDFIYLARNKHGSKYDYSLVTRYKGTQPIICPIHGVFYQDIRQHVTGAGCRKCKHKIMSPKQAMEYINKYTGNHFTFKEFEYENTSSYFVMYCKETGKPVVTNIRALRRRSKCRHCKKLFSEIKEKDIA